MSMLQVARSGILAAVLAAAGSGCLGAAAQQPRPAAQQEHLLNLNDVDIRAFIDDVATVTGYTFIVHPMVTGRVTVVSRRSLSAADVFQVFISTLRANGFAVVPAGRDSYRIVPEAAAAGEARIVSEGGVPGSFVTEVTRLANIDADQVAIAIKTVLTPQGRVVANRASNTLIVVDDASNMPRVRDIVSRLDADRTQVETVALRNIAASEMERVLLGFRDQQDASFSFSVVAAPTSNVIVIRGGAEAVAKAKALATQLDQTEIVQDNLRVITLKNAKAAEIVPVLERLAGTFVAQKPPSASAAAVASPGGGIPGNGPTIAAHEQTNSLVISADYETLTAIEKVIEALDVRRPQVLVEAIIVEMSDSAARELGLQFLVAGRGGDAPFISQNFSRSAPNLLALAGALVFDSKDSGGSGANGIRGAFGSAAISSLLNLGGLTVGVGGTNNDNLFGVILNAIQNDSRSNILSTPSIMTMDNATSKFLVGQEIPVTTGETLGSDNLNAFRTIDRRDVGVKLNVQPQIGEGGTIRLNIEQEVSNVSGAVGAEADQLVTNKRSINTTVLADDGEVIVLGGLIQEDNGAVASRVPLLGDIPGVGSLFRSKGRSSSRTNLMVFIRPTIVRDKDDARAVTAQKYGFVRAESLARSGSSASPLDAFIRGVLGAEPPAYREDGR